ncbi:MAG: phage holin family protein [Verrucomicrobiae bacterium]|nr:phage holin family protein [Verrucomicrobiae bacterium]
MKQAFFRWMILTLGVWIAANIVPHIRYDDWQSLLIAALVLGILNTFVKPIISLLSLPFIVLTFGLFLVLINGFLLYLTTQVVHGFHVDGFWAHVWGALVISIVSFFLGGGGRRRAIVRVNPPSPSSMVDAQNAPKPPPGKGEVIDI